MVGRTLEGVLDDGDETLKLFGGEVTSALLEIDIGLLADQVGVAATDTGDLGQGVHDLLLTIDVRVQQTDDVLEAGEVSVALWCDKPSSESSCASSSPERIEYQGPPLQSNSMPVPSSSSHHPHSL